MKRILLFYFLFPCIGFAQNATNLHLTNNHSGYIRCATTEYCRELKKSNPAIAEQESEVSVKINEWLFKHKDDFGKYRGDVSPSPAFLITIPVVVHVIYQTSDQNLPDNVIQSQIDVLNRDYTRTNTDTSQTPVIWRHTAGNSQIQFCLAQRTPANQSTNGIERRQSDSLFDDFSSMKFFSSGGLDAWDPNHYLNIWVCNLQGGLLGFGTQPSAAGTSIDGVVIAYSVFGTVGNQLHPVYNKGRTTTHEVGHWLGLYHPWGDDGGACWGTDSINDTPNQASNTYGCPAYPLTDACSSSFPGIMFMNFMDYTDDVCMNLFTYNQSQKINAVLNTVRVSIISSSGCTPVGIQEPELGRFVYVYPNPASDAVYIRTKFPAKEDVNVYLVTILGKEVYSETIKNVFNETLEIPASELAAGIYQLSLITKDGIAAQRISIIR